jgi:drug/metabolite transporter (DMT)-like permease
MGLGLWLFLGLGAAVGDSGCDVVTKRSFSGLPPYGMAMARVLAAVPFLLLAALFVRLPSLPAPFWAVVGAMLPLEVTATLLYMRALKTCHLSLCIPLLAFTPVFIIFTGWLFLGERLNYWGISGIALIASGSYLLGLGINRGGGVGFWAPLRALAREAGARYMLAVAAIYSFTATLYKLAILHSAPVFFGVSYPLAFILLMSAGLPWSRAPLRPAVRSQFAWWLVGGFCYAMSCLALAQGLTLAPAGYLIAVKRLSLLLSVTLGGLWLQERPFLPRLVGAGLMCSGVVLIALRG